MDYFPVKDAIDLCSRVSSLYAAIHATQEKLLPKIKSRRGNGLARWWNVECAKLKTARNKSSRLLKASMAKEKDPDKLEQHRNVLRKNSNNYYHGLAFQKKLYLQDIVASSDTSQDWKIYTRHILDPRKKRIPLLKDGTGVVVDSWQQNFLLFEERFFGVTNPHASLSFTPCLPSKANFPPILKQEVVNAMDGMGNLTSGGPDMLNITLMKEIFTSILPILLIIMNAILRFSHHPQVWKHATTVILAKSGKDDYNLADAYRPIALLNILTRIFEGIIAKRLSFLSEARGLIPPQQHGFRKYHQTSDGLLDLKNSVKRNWSEKRTTSGCSLDIKGAYDNVNHSILLEKLDRMKIPKYLTFWLANFLMDRSTRLVNKCEAGDLLFLSKGLPQGSPLSPILFVLFTSDLIDELAALIPTTSYADDIFIYTADISVSKNIDRLKDAFNVATRWGNKNMMSFDHKKTALIHFSRSKTQEVLNSFVMNLWGKNIRPRKEIYFLGVYFDTQLTWETHLQWVAKRAEAKWNFFVHRSRSLGHLTYNTRRTLYKGVIDPVFTYCAVVWHDATSSRFVPIEKAMYKMCRQICGAMDKTKRSTSITEAGLIPIRIRVETVARTHLAKKNAKTKDMLTIRQFHRGTVP